MHRENLEHELTYSVQVIEAIAPHYRVRIDVC